MTSSFLSPSRGAAPRVSSQEKGLDVIALISGGKDSLYSILHCIKNGHRVVALANLHPPLPQKKNEGEEEEEDMDSFMYQTIGHQVIPLYESALGGIPLYRAPITGGAVDTERVYRYRHDHVHDENETPDQKEQLQDETECLIPLLKRIMQAHPSANAVSAGAILSTYQRTRIENVAQRLGLVPLAWLWMYPVLPAPEDGVDVDRDAGLLEDMAFAGCDARIIKVASGGLDEDSLWMNVASKDANVRRRIIKAMRRFDPVDYRGAVLGEGGEYETLALDGPSFLWKQRIEIEETQRTIKKGEGGVSYVTISGARCVPKLEDGDTIKPGSIKRPALLDLTFKKALENLSLGGLPLGSTAAHGTTKSYERDDAVIETIHSTAGRTWTISNITAPEAGPQPDRQMQDIAEKLRKMLSYPQFPVASSRTTADIVFATILLRSMSDFVLINSTYASLFQMPSPPARVTVACGDSLPDGVQVMASFVVDLGARESRQGLHVQSRSYWAPANIGPYSQAIAVPINQNNGDTSGGGLVYIAGQIPLNPASMDLVFPQSDADEWFRAYTLHATLSLQHLWRIGEAMQVDWWAGAVAFFAQDGSQIQAKASYAWKLWEQFHQAPTEEAQEDQETELDAWDIKYGRREDPQINSDQRSILPNFTIVDGDPKVPPFLAVEVDQLPRASDIEWQGLGIQSKDVRLVSKNQIDEGTRSRSTVISNDLIFRYVELDLDDSNLSLEDRVNEMIKELGDDGAKSHLTVYASQQKLFLPLEGQIVPCRTVWGISGRQLAAGIVIRTIAAPRM